MRSGLGRQSVTVRQNISQHKCTCVSRRCRTILSPFSLHALLFSLPDCLSHPWRLVFVCTFTWFMALHGQFSFVQLYVCERDLASQTGDTDWANTQADQIPTARERGREEEDRSTARKRGIWKGGSQDVWFTHRVIGGGGIAFACNPIYLVVYFQRMREDTEIGGWT